MEIDDPYELNIIKEKNEFQNREIHPTQTLRKSMIFRKFGCMFWSSKQWRISSTFLSGNLKVIYMGWKPPAELWHIRGAPGKKAMVPRVFAWKCLTNACSLSKNSFEHVLNMFWLSGWWLSHPSEKWWSSSVGMMTLPTEWKGIKFHGSSHHQPKLSTPIKVVKYWK